MYIYVLIPCGLVLISFSGYLIFYENNVEKKKNKEIKKKLFDHIEKISKRIDQEFEKSVVVIKDDDLSGKGYPCVTKKGENVKSISEKRIADFFYKQNISFNYEKEFPYPEENIIVRPDFYLVKYNIIVEYHGLYVKDKEDLNYNPVYNKRIWDKREFYKLRNIKLVELYPDNCFALENFLMKRLHDVGSGINFGEVIFYNDQTINETEEPEEQKTIIKVEKEKYKPMIIDDFAKNTNTKKNKCYKVDYNLKRVDNKDTDNENSTPQIALEDLPY